MSETNEELLTELRETLAKILSVLYDIQEDTSSTKWSLKELVEK